MINVRFLKSANKRSGFTLIEILVVIAIIVLLVSILFPVFARARENARRTSCQSHLKQLAIAGLQYIQDHDERFFGVYTGPLASQVRWMERIDPYVKSDPLFFCPSDRGSRSSSPITTSNISYCYNNFYLSGNGNSNNESAGGILISRIPYPSQTVMFAESVNRGGQQYTCRAAGSNEPTAPHLGGGNFAYVDGHVKWSKNGSTIYLNDTLWDLN